MTSFLILLVHLFLHINLSSSSSNTPIFNSWCEQHGKKYSTDEEKLFRRGVFEDNLAFITQHNSPKNSSYTLALNAFADLTHHEFKASWLGLSLAALHNVHPFRKPALPLGGSKAIGENKIPSSMDWRNRGAVTPVKNQASCGSSWAFSATGAIEGINKIVTGSLVSLSEQELVDCDRSYSSSGCNGGHMESAYQWNIGNHGISTKEDYPNKAGERETTCKKNKSERNAVSIEGYTAVPANDEEKLLHAVASQPVSTGICGSERAFQFYSKGIFSGPCSSSLDHAVLIVGYGTESGVDFWIVKNSWGTNWGMNGYAHILRNSGNRAGVCGINMLASYPIKTKTSPKSKPLLQSTSSSVTCDFLRYCRDGTTCCCSNRFIICLAYICCRADFEIGVCCDGYEQCCPNGYICDKGTCTQVQGNATMAGEFGQSSYWKFGGYVP